MKAIMTKYIPATGTKGSRIKAYDGDGNQVTIPYPSEKDGAACYAEAAVNLCQKMGWTYGGALVSGGIKDGCVFVFENSDRFEI